MNVLRIFAPLALCLPFAWAQCETMSCSVGCDSYYELCIETDGCIWDDGDSYCESADGQNEASCCQDVTTTPAPTRPPTCASASTSTEDDPCYGLEEDCCTTRHNSLYCEYSTSELCTVEGGPSCCEMIGSDSTTTTTTEWEADSTTTTQTTSSTEWEATTTTTPSPTCPTASSTDEDSCYGLEEDCCDYNSAICEYSTSELCTAEGGPDCCGMIETTTSTTTSTTTADPTTATPTTAAPTTAEPTTADPTTAEPTTAEPTTAEPTTAEPTTAEPTTAEPTTAEPTTAEPTTAEPTTSSPTTAEPTTSSPTTSSPTTSDPTTASPTTASPTTSEPTTSEPTTADPTTAEPTTADPTTASPTTSEPTTSSPTTPSPTTPYPTTDIPTVAEETTTTDSYPTPRPTMKSALKWDMIHPQYKGSDGELLWHVYYGDFSDDERFDGFRKNELWDADVIRPILQMDIKFDRFSMASAKKGQNKQLSLSAGTPAMSSVTQHSSYGVWLVLVGVVLVGAFAYWLKFKSGDSKLFNQSLLNLEAKTLIARNKEDECYVY